MSADLICSPVPYRIEHPHPLNSLSCLAWVDSITATNGAKPYEYFTIY